MTERETMYVVLSDDGRRIRPVIVCRTIDAAADEVGAMVRTIVLDASTPMPSFRIERVEVMP